MSQVFINDKGWVEVIWGKRIDAETYLETAGKMLKFITQIEDQDQAPLMLIDFSQLEEITPEAAQLATNATRDLGCKKIAGFGIKPQFKAVLDTIKHLSTKEDTIGEFATRQEAEEWLSKP